MLSQGTILALWAERKKLPAALRNSLREPQTQRKIPTPARGPSACIQARNSGDRFLIHVRHGQKKAFWQLKPAFPVLRMGGVNDAAHVYPGRYRDTMGRTRERKTTAMRKCRQDFRRRHVTAREAEDAAGQRARDTAARRGRTREVALMSGNKAGSGRRCPAVARWTPRRVDGAAVFGRTLQIQMQRSSRVRSLPNARPDDGR